MAGDVPVDATADAITPFSIDGVRYGGEQRQAFCSELLASERRADANGEVRRDVLGERQREKRLLQVDTRGTAAIHAGAAIGARRDCTVEVPVVRARTVAPYGDADNVDKRIACDAIGGGEIRDGELERVALLLTYGGQAESARSFHLAGRAEQAEGRVDLVVSVHEAGRVDDGYRCVPAVGGAGTGKSFVA